MGFGFTSLLKMEGGKNTQAARSAKREEEGRRK
jgi:hypothetical protein